MRLALCAVLALTALSAAPAPQTSEPFVPIGVWYGGGTARAPMVVRDPAPERDAWRRDLATIKSLGFNSVKTWIDWGSAEPERGRYRFDALDQLLSLAGEIDLKVIVQVYTDAAPEWLGKRYPDSSFVSDQGVRIGSQASPGYCLDHAGVRADMVAFIGAVSSAAARHQAFYAIDVWSEPHLVNWVWFNTPVEFCYCPHTQARFREWLKTRYRTVEALNGAWYRTFTSWDEPEAPRYGTILSYSDFIDWKTFVAVKLQEDLKLKADASAPRGARLVSSHSDAPAVMLSPLSGFGNPDDWWMTQPVDHYGTSIYPKHAAAATPWSPVPPDLRARRHSLGGARQRLVDGRAPGRAGGDGRARRRAGHGRRPAVVGLGGDLARRARDQLLRLVSDELRVRVQRLRHDRARRDRHPPGEDRGRVRRGRRAQRGALRADAPASLARRHPVQQAVVHGRWQHRDAGNARPQLDARHLPRAVRAEHPGGLHSSRRDRRRAGVEIRRRLSELSGDAAAVRGRCAQGVRARRRYAHQRSAPGVEQRARLREHPHPRRRSGRSVRRAREGTAVPRGRHVHRREGSRRLPGAARRPDVQRAGICRAPGGHGAVHARAGALSGGRKRGRRTRPSSCRAMAAAGRY